MINKDESVLFIERFSKYIQDISSILLNRWLQSCEYTEQDLLYADVKLNVQKVIEFIHIYIKTRDITPMIELTKQIAKERIKKDITINNYVYNINIGRSIINELVIESHLCKEDKLKGIMAVNQFFDDFIYHAIHEYTKLKDSILINKTKFIKEMHHDRLTIVGQIAASFAHEFRNPLTSIKGFVKMLEKKYGDNPENGFYFDIIKLELESLEDKVSQFLYLSKSKGLDDEMEVLDFSAIANQMIEFMYPRFVDENIEVITNIEDHCLTVGVKEQIKQVLLNILNNAVDELAEKQVSRKIEFSVNECGDWIECSISNNGKCIPDYLIDNIFEPFVTTKKLGTGLGLSVVKQIIEKHDANISVQSNEEKTTFLINWKKAK